MNRSQPVTTRQRRQNPVPAAGFASPISVSLTLRHLALIDARRGHGGHLSRSAALRQALDRLLDLEAQLATDQTA